MISGKVGITLCILIVLTLSLSAQQKLTIEEVIVRAMDSSYQLKAAYSQIEHDRLMEKKATHLPDPELILESPTGDFMVLGVQQSFEFPTVYTSQKKLAVQQSILSEKSKTVTEAALRLKIKSAYLEWQYAIAASSQWQIQDSLFLLLSETATRQHLAGQIDAAEKSYAALKYAEIHARFLSSQLESDKGMRRLQLYSGIEENIEPTPLEKQVNSFLVTNDSIDHSFQDNTPIMAYYQQAEKVGERAIQLEKNRVLPDITIGYLNQAGRDTPFGQRMRFGLSVPLWFWQYGTSVKAAETRLTIARQTTAAGGQALSHEWSDAKNDGFIHLAAMDYYESEGLPQANELMETARRLFEAGQYDYIKYITTLSDAFAVKQQYLELVKRFNQSNITLQYIIGQ